jgi:hypothetical protein
VDVPLSPTHTALFASLIFAVVFVLGAHVARENWRERQRQRTKAPGAAASRSSSAANAIGMSNLLQERLLGESSDDGADDA